MLCVGGCLVQLKHVQKGLRVLPPGLEPRDWVVQLGGGHSPLGLLCVVAVCLRELLSQGEWVDLVVE